MTRVVSLLVVLSLFASTCPGQSQQSAADDKQIVELSEARRLNPTDVAALDGRARRG